MLKKLLTTYFSLYLALSLVTSQANSNTQSTNQLTTKTYLQNQHQTQLINSSYHRQIYLQQKLQAKTIQITTDLLNLVSDKDLDIKQVKNDSSGLLTKTITDKDHNKPTKIVAHLDALG
jgi:hypothetical protein